MDKGWCLTQILEYLGKRSSARGCKRPKERDMERLKQGL